jgi:hypothetical protein
VPADLGWVTAIAAGETHSIALQSDGTIACFGRSWEGQCSPPAGLGPITAIAAFQNVTVAFFGPNCITPTLSSFSGELGAIGTGVPRQHEFLCPRAPAAEATITVRVRSDLGAVNESITVQLDGANYATCFVASGTDCPAGVDVATIGVPVADLAPLVADGALVVRLVASSAVSATQCASGSCEIALSYPMEFLDCDADGIDDACELASGGDLDGDGRLDACEIPGDLDGNGRVDGGDMTAFLVAWAQGNLAVGDLNGDGLINAQDLASLLANWG